MGLDASKAKFIGLLPFFRPIDFSQFTTDPHESMDFDGFTLDFSIKLVFFTMKLALEMERHVVGCPSVLDGRRKTVPCEEMRGIGGESELDPSIVI